VRPDVVFVCPDCHARIVWVNDVSTCPNPKCKGKQPRIDTVAQTNGMVERIVKAVIALADAKVKRYDVGDSAKTSRVPATRERFAAAEAAVKDAEEELRKALYEALK
jgi:phospholipase/lecithinase/hemolysin